MINCLKSERNYKQQESYRNGIVQAVIKCLRKNICMKLARLKRNMKGLLQHWLFIRPILKNGKRNSLIYYGKDGYHHLHLYWLTQERREVFRYHVLALILVIVLIASIVLSMR